MKSLRQQINDDLTYVANNPGMPASMADELATKLSAQLGTLSDYEADFRRKAYTIMSKSISDGTAIGSAEALMKMSEDYANYKKSQGLYKSVLEVIYSLRLKVRSAEQQFKSNIG